MDNFNEWHVTNCHYGCLTDIYFTDGDTIVDGLNYKILDGYHYISRTFLLREDLELKKVYLNLVQSSGNREFLLYDFSMAVGDSIDIKNPISPFPENAGYYKVDSIVNKPLVDGNLYKHLYLSPTSSNTISSTPATWIEGIGSLSIINAPGGFPDIDGVGYLTCFFKNGELFYSNEYGTSECEPIILGNVPDYNALQQATMNTIIKDGKGTVENARDVELVDVFDLNGKKLMSINAHGIETIDLDFSSFSAGMYLVLARSKELEQKVFKVIVM